MDRRSDELFAYERCENCQFFMQLKHNFKVGIGYEDAYCCTVFTKVSDGFVVETAPNDMCECFKRKEMD